MEINILIKHLMQKTEKKTIIYFFFYKWIKTLQRYQK